MLNEYRHQINKRLPGLLPLFASVEDSRKRRDYNLKEILMGGVGLFLFKEGSRNGFNNKRKEESFAANYSSCFGVRLPHQDTVTHVLRQLNPDRLERVKMDLMSSQFEQRWLRPYRLLGKYYLVAVDATGVVSFDYPHCEHCLTKTSKNGKVNYFHYVLEAKLVTSGGHCLSLATEWVENPEGEFDKQDCEQKAFVRLADKLKKQYPRLPICILGDGLYPNNTVFDLCTANGWKFLLVLKDDQLKSIQGDLVLPKRRKPVKENYVVKDGWRISNEYRIETGIPYRKHTLHWLQCIETKKKDTRGAGHLSREATVTTFEYLTNIEPTEKTVIALSAGARLRWKIENEGFNTQKKGGYDLQHKYCRNSYTGLKNYYTLLQIAHFINQLVEKSKLVKEILKEHSKETIKNIWCNLIAYMLYVTPEISNRGNEKSHPT